MGRNHHRCRFDRFRLRAYLSWTIMAAEVPFLAATHKHSRAFLRARTHKLRHPPHCVDQHLRANLSGTHLADRFRFNTLLTIASEMILVPYFLVGGSC